MKPVYQVAGLFALGVPTNVLAARDYRPANPVVAAVAPAQVVPAPVSSATSTPATVPNPIAAGGSLGATSGGTTSSNSSSGPCSGVQVNFVTEGGTYNWLYHGFGGDSGNSATKDPSRCFEVGSGAFFVGSEAASLGAAWAGNTIIECAIVADGGQNVCDVSLCDGYSMAVQCEGFGDVGSSNAQIGGTSNLWTLGSCPSSNVVGPNCINPGSHQDSAPDFFTRGGSYWHNDNNPNPGHASFYGRGPVTCTIYAGTSRSSKLKREAAESEGIELEARAAIDSEVLEVRSHGHKTRAHARGLRNLVTAPKA